MVGEARRKVEPGRGRRSEAERVAEATPPLQSHRPVVFVIAGHWTSRRPCRTPRTAAVNMIHPRARVRKEEVVAMVAAIYRARPSVGWAMWRCGGPRVCEEIERGGWGLQEGDRGDASGAAGAQGRRPAEVGGAI